MPTVPVVTAANDRLPPPFSSVRNCVLAPCPLRLPPIGIVRSVLRSNIVLDDQLFHEAMKLANVRTIREMVDLALRRYVRIVGQRKLLRLLGSGGVRRGYHYKRARSAA